MQNHTPIPIASTPLALEVKASATGVIEGYASTYGGEADAHGHIIKPGAFAASLAASKARGDVPAMLWAHAQERPVGKWTDLAEDSKGLFVRGQINLNTVEGRDSYEHVKAGDTTGLSIGYAGGDPKYIGDGVYELDAIDLFEISIVAIPSNRNARITAAKSFGSKSEVVDALRGVGFARKAATMIAAGGWPALSGEPDNTPQIAAFAAQIDRATALIKEGR